jgi:metallo-beta-lactamase family protein
LVAGSPAKSISRPEPRIDPAELKRDWHNEYADFILKLSEKLQATKTSHQRRELIDRLSKSLREE